MKTLKKAKNYEKTCNLTNNESTKKWMYHLLSKELAGISKTIKNLILMSA